MARCPITDRGNSAESNPFRVELNLNRPRATFRDILRMMRPFYWPGASTDPVHKKFILRLFVYMAIVLLFCAKAANLLAPHFMGMTVTSLSQGNREDTIKYLIITAAMYMCGTSCDELRNVFYGYVQCTGLTTLALSIYQHLHSLNYQWYVESKSGEVIRCMIRGIESMRDLTRYGVLLLVPTIIESVAVCIVFALYFRMLWLTVTVVMGLCIYIVMTIVVTNWRNATRKAQVQRDNELHNISNDGLNNFETVKYYTNEKYEVKRYTYAARQHELCHWRVLKSLSMLNVSQEVLKQTTMVLCLYFSVLGVVDGRLAVGEVVAIQNYLFQVFRPLYILGTMYSTMCNAIAGIQSVADLMQCRPDVVDKPDASELVLDVDSASKVPMIEFRNVYFAYPSIGASASGGMIRDINIKVPKGHSLAIVGSTGSGKTTIGRLLCRFYDTHRGSILVNGIDITDVTQHSLRRSIGVVSQETVLFHTSIRDNIRYAKLDATDEEVYEALKQASLYDRVMSFPDKLDTIVGERGMRLSGGEKQRVSIARCFLKNPPIIILDEATSSLDSKTEAQIQITLGSLFHNRTVLTIAHRLSTIVHCDAILLLENGIIREYGSHSDLLHLNGLYKSMWEAQQSSPESTMPEVISQ
ncbi:ABC transporter family protein [Babesia divergens]|uniref:ABC transporter family protein n=1 Tax=Babesia divergens TaxID=32595 RepID=A0AAD9LJ73_BABDI|nr:ABC transporter family protein [Babesia divergens]